MNSRIARGILSWIGVAGIGITSWLSVKCSKRANQYDEEDKKKRLKCYTPAIASGIITAGCVIGSNKLADKEIAALAAGCAYLANNKNKLQAYIKEKQDEKSLIEAKKSTDKNIAPWEGPSIEWTGKGMTLCFDTFSGRLFYSSKEAVEKAQESFNTRRSNEKRLNLNDLYEAYGIQKTHFGAQWGWPVGLEYGSDPIRFINREDIDEHGEKIILIDMYEYPIECWPEQE